MSEKKLPRPRRTYTPEFKQQLVDLYRSGKRKCDIVREYDIANSLLDKWIAQTNNSGSFKRKIIVLLNNRSLLNFVNKTNSLKWRMTF